MKKIVIIPARWGSTRLLGKPLQLLSGKPMIRRVYERCKKAHVDEVIVATDETRILEVVEAFGGKAIITSKENRSGTDRVAEAAKLLDLAQEDLIINVQGDQPLIHPECIDDVTRPFAEDPDLTMASLGVIIENPAEIQNPGDVKIVLDVKGNALYFSRAPIPHIRDKGTPCSYIKHLGIYAYTRRFLEIFKNLPSGELEEIEKLEQLRVLEHGHTIRIAITAHDSPEVDVAEDVAQIEAILKTMKEI